MAVGMHLGARAIHLVFLFPMHFRYCTRSLLARFSRGKEVTNKSEDPRAPARRPIDTAHARATKSATARTEGGGSVFPELVEGSRAVQLAESQCNQKEQEDGSRSRALFGELARERVGEWAREWRVCLVRFRRLHAQKERRK